MGCKRVITCGWAAALSYNWQDMKPLERMRQQYRSGELTESLTLVYPVPKICLTSNSNSKYRHIRKETSLYFYIVQVSILQRFYSCLSSQLYIPLSNLSAFMMEKKQTVNSLQELDFISNPLQHFILMLPCYWSNTDHLRMLPVFFKHIATQAIL